MLTLSIQSALKNSCHFSELFEVMEYAVLPAGKLFRPRLVEAIALDSHKGMTKNHYHLAAAIELHHAYTLVHDDLPSMDNDLVRRGRPATHVQFGEWKAILGGDALLIASFNELTNIRHDRFHEIFKFMTWATGPKGLIKGQFLDLSAKNKASVSDVVRIHELKTARLIQLCTIGSYLLNSSYQFRDKIEFMRLGREIGLGFQLLDDLTELAHTEVSPHEMEINPFIQNGEHALKELKDSHQRLKMILSKHNLIHVEKMLHDYFASNQEFLLKNFLLLEKNVGNDLNYLKNWVTNFV